MHLHSLEWHSSTIIEVFPSTFCMQTARSKPRSIQLFSPTLPVKTCPHCPSVLRARHRRPMLMYQLMSHRSRGPSRSSHRAAACHSLHSQLQHVLQSTSRVI